MKKLLAILIIALFPITGIIAQTKSKTNVKPVVHKETPVEYITKNFKEKYVDVYFADPYSYKLLKVWTTSADSTRHKDLNDSLTTYKLGELKLMGWIKEKNDSTIKIRFGSDSTWFTLSKLKSRINYISSLSYKERSAIKTVIKSYRVYLDCYARSRNGNESLMRLVIACDVLPDGTYHVKWWDHSDGVYEYNK